jgi:hypothetical protein
MELHIRPLLTLLAGALFIVAFSAIGVSSAAASTTEECKIPLEGEEFTSQHFSDENCEKKSGAEGLFHTTLVAPTSILITTKTSPIVIWSEPSAGVKLKLACGSVGGTKTVSNFTEGEVRGFKGEGSIVLSECSVQEPEAGCTVSPTIETVPLTLKSEDLKETQRTLFQPKEGSKVATFTVSGCALKGTYTIEGKFRSQTVTIHTEEFGPKTGSELTISKGIPIVLEWWYHEATKANGKLITRELP